MHGDQHGDFAAGERCVQYGRKASSIGSVQAVAFFAEPVIAVARDAWSNRADECGKWPPTPYIATKTVTCFKFRSYSFDAHSHDHFLSLIGAVPMTAPHLRAGGVSGRRCERNSECRGDVPARSSGSAAQLLATSRQALGLARRCVVLAKRHCFQRRQVEHVAQGVVERLVA